MRYKDYSANDLIKDELFQQWVFAPTEETNRFWLTFLQEYPGHRDRIEEARQFLSVFNVKDKDVFEARIGNLKRRIDHTIDHPDTVSHPPVPEMIRMPRRNSRRAVLVKIAASVSILSLSALLIYYYYVYSASGGERIDATLQEEVTPRGQRTMVQLADGSNVWLNADSRLEHSGNFSREVSLEGEAFFEITEHKDKPFVIHTAGAVIRVMGTLINVRSYPEEERIEITLVNGKATLGSKDRQLRQVALASGQQAIVEKTLGRLILENQADVKRSTAWKNGVLVFNDLPFSGIKTILERWYDVTIQTEDEEALRCRFSGELDNKTLEEAMTWFKSSGGFSYQIEDKEVFINGKLCPDDDK